MAFKESDVEKLDEAIVATRGATEMTFSDQTARFSVDDMLKLRSIMKREAESAPSYRLAVVSKGT